MTLSTEICFDNIMSSFCFSFDQSDYQEIELVDEREKLLNGLFQAFLNYWFLSSIKLIID